MSGNPLQRLIHRVASSATGARLFSVLLPPLDSLVLKASGGRQSLTGAFTGLPVYQLTTIGAKSGLERKSTLLGVADGDRVILIASNWGQKQYPAWYHNLKANPEARLTTKGKTGTYVAREVSGPERQAAWAQATAMYPGYDQYRARTGGRVIPVLVLEPAEGA